MQICMAAAVRGAAAGSHVVYLDTSNAVTLRRLMQLHAALLQVMTLTKTSVKSHASLGRC